ncbi:hypothetical protein DL770_004187 [Monosporascus sp. CRB-9-2]|nr:hypothetical protein DL770_004187 [Monosporascus sp. CRB-9-2]
MAISKLRFNIAYSARVATDDHTETVLVNAVEDILQDPATPDFASNRMSAPEESFLRVDASVWIGTPGGPMGWDVGSTRQGLYPDQRWGTPKHVGYPAISSDSPLYLEEKKEEGPKRKQKRKSEVVEVGSPRKREKVLDADEDGEQVAPRGFGHDDKL